MNAPNEVRVAIVKRDAKKQIVYGEVYVPYVPDSQGDFMTPDEIERVAHEFLKKGDTTAIDTEHNLTRSGSAVVESFVARSGDPDFTAGAWVLGVHIPDKDHWAKAERGEIGGFSMYGTGRRVQRVVEVDIPDDGVLFGKTADSHGDGAHSHEYALDFDANGAFLGGETDEVNGHSHVIRKGTVTEPGPDGHRHRFSFIENLSKGCSGRGAWRKKRGVNKGDYPGHPFRGNQYVDGDGAGTTISDGNPMGAGGGGGLPARRGRKDYVNLEGRARVTSDFSAGKAYVTQFSDGEQMFFLPQTKLKNGNWRGRKLNEGAGGRSRGKSVQDIFEPPFGRSMLRWYELNDDEIPVHLRKEDMTAEDLPETSAQDQAPCKRCATPRACKRAGHCLIEAEDGEACETCGK
jgi:hypothetical protein